MQLKKLFLAMLPHQIQGTDPVANGADVDYSSLINTINQLQANGQSVAGGSNFQTSAGATITLTALGGLLQRLTNGGAVTVTLDYAYNIGLTLPQPLSLNQTFETRIITNAGTTVATPTLSDEAVTLAGTTSVLAAALRWYQGKFTQISTTTTAQFTAGTTFTSIAQVGSTNAYTLTIAGNSVVAVAGQLVHLNVTTGTLPSGWYPIAKVNGSTTAPIIMLPPNGVAWTCTAATIDGVAPASPVYSPLITLTGVMATVVNTMSV